MTACVVVRAYGAMPYGSRRQRNTASLARRAWCPELTAQGDRVTQPAMNRFAFRGSLVLIELMTQYE